MRRADDAKDWDQQSVQRNVSDAFDMLLRRLDKVYHAASAEAPTDFLVRIDYWRKSCGLPPDVHSRMHRLRIWRNASLHHDR